MTPTVTKEDVLGTWKEVPTDNGVYEMVLKQHALVSMDIWAEIKSRERAIGFSKYLVNKEGCVPIKDENGEIKWYYIEDDKFFQSNTEQLYQQYLNTLLP